MQRRDHWDRRAAWSLWRSGQSCTTGLPAGEPHRAPPGRQRVRIVDSALRSSSLNAWPRTARVHEWRPRDPGDHCVGRQPTWLLSASARSTVELRHINMWRASGCWLRRRGNARHRRCPIGSAGRVDALRERPRRDALFAADDVSAANVPRLQVAWQWKHWETPLKEYGTTPGQFEVRP